jgi:hypothetical protein
MGTARFSGCHHGVRRGRWRDSLAILVRSGFGIGPLTSLTAALTQRVYRDNAQELAAAFALLKVHAVLHQRDAVHESSDKDEKGY